MTDASRTRAQAKPTKAQAQAPAKGKNPLRKTKNAPDGPTAKFNAAGIDAICSRIKDGETLTGIANSFGAGVASLFDWLAADPERSARAREARTVAAAAYDEMAQREIQRAGDPFELSRAKELAHHLRWRASKVNPAYGDKTTTELTGPGGGAIQHSLAVRFVSGEGSAANAGSNKADSASREG